MAEQGGVGIRLYVSGQQVVTQAFDHVADSGKKMWAQIAQGEKSANPAILGLSRGVNLVKTEAGSMIGSVSGAAGSLVKFGVAGVAAAAAVAAVAFGLKEAREGMDFADELSDTATQLGVTTDALQEWRYVLQASGGDAKQADAALAAFRRTFGAAKADLSERAVRPFKALGFTEEDLKAFKSVDDILPEVTKRIADLSDTAQQAAIADKLGLTGLLPALQQGSQRIAELRDEAHKLGIVMDGELVKRAGEAHDQFEVTSQVIKTQLMQAFVDLGPVLVWLTGLVGGLAKAISDVADMWRKLEDKSSDGLRKQIDSLYKTRAQAQKNYDKAVDDKSPRLQAMFLTQRNALDAQIEKIDSILTGREPTAPALGGGNLAPPAPSARRAKAREPTLEDLGLVDTTGNMHQVDPSTVFDVNAAARDKMAQDAKAISEAWDAMSRDLNTDGLAPARDWFAMKDQERQQLTEDVGQAFSAGIDAAVHGDFWDFLKQNLYRAALEGMGQGLAEAFMKATANSGVGNFLASGVSTLFGVPSLGGHRAGGGGLNSGMMYRIGDAGEPELGVFGAQGQLFNAREVQRLLGGGAHGVRGDGVQRVEIVSKIELPADHLSDRQIMTAITRAHDSAVAKAVDTVGKVGPGQQIQYSIYKG